MLHALGPNSRNLHGTFSRELQPVLTIEPGDSVALDLPDGMWTLESGEQLVPRDPAVETGHALIGPIEVRGALAGQILVVAVDAVRAGRDATLALLRARRALDGPPRATPGLPEWSGG